MAADATVFDYGGRPCQVTGTATAYSRKFRCHYDMTIVQFLDGREPRTAKISRGKFKAAKPIRGGQAQVWRRVFELVSQGMEGARARKQAMDEQQHYMLVM